MMQFIVANITPVASFFILLSNIVFVAFCLGMIFHSGFRDRVYSFVYNHILSFIFWISGFALVGSLAYSNIVGFPACELCWVQRIFMYPQTLLAFIGIVKKEKSIVDYLLPMSVLGGIVALYHSYIQWGGGLSLAPCVANGGACAKIFVSEYNYITIPFMSFTVFAYLITVSIIYYRARKKYGRA